MKHTVTEHKLKNGARGLVIHVSGSDVVRIQSLFNSGFAFGSRDKYELSHVMEHLMLSGSKKFPAPLQFKAEAEKNGAYLNAFTNTYLNGYVYECSAFEAPRIMAMLADQLTEPLFPEETFETEVGTVEEELSNLLTNYSSLAYNSLTAAMVPAVSERFDERIKQLPSIRNSDVRAFYEKTHSSANMRFFVAGDFPDGGKKIVGEFDRMLAGFTLGKRAEIAKLVPRSPTGPVLLRREIKQLYYAMHFYLGDLTPLQRAHVGVLSMLFTGGWTSWVLGQARSKGLAYGVYSSGVRQPNMSSFSYSYFVTPGNAEALFGLIVDGFRKARAGDFTEQDIDAAKTMQIGRIMMSNQTPSDLVGWYGETYNNENRIRNLDEHISYINQTSKADIVAIANKIGLGGLAHGLSLVGDIDEAFAGKLYQILQPIWSH